MTRYTGGCHCGAVRYEVEMELDKVLECNCSHCHKKGILLTFADNKDFTLTQGAEYLSEYWFNKKSIRHLFCEICGVQSFAEHLAVPSMVINARCLDGVDTSSLTVEKYNGKDI